MEITTRETMAAKARGRELRRRRQALGLTQWELAERARIDQSTVSKLESGAGGTVLALGRVEAALVKMEIGLCIP